MDVITRPDIVLFEPLSHHIKLSPFHKGLLKRLNIHTLTDLCFYIPHSVQQRRFFSSIAELKQFYIEHDPEFTTKAGFIAEVVLHEMSKVRHVPSRVIVKDATAGLELVFFNQKSPYLVSKLPVGRRFAFGGTISSYLGKLHMVQPEQIIDPVNKDTLQGNERVYSLTKGLNQSFFKNVMPVALSKLPQFDEWDAETQLTYNWPTWKEAITTLHTAKTSDDLLPSTPHYERLAYDELLAHQLSMLLMKQAYHRVKGVERHAEGTLVEKTLNLLPFSLTSAQRLAYREIIDDLESTHQMHRLIQGDVGSGKTIVAILGMLHAVEAGFQSTLLAPTDILARQHFANIKPLCDQLGITSALFTGRDKAAERRTNLEALERGDIDIAVGTHALIQEKIKFKKLGFSVVDEQHKFGVSQRAALSEKGNFIDTLFMSATPIPRTIVLSRYGDLDVSIIGEKPPGRKEINTLVMPSSKEPDLVESLSRSIAQGNQVYWVCPLVEESEALDLTAAEERFKQLQEALPHLNIGLVHGRMKGPEKDAIMQEFKAGNLQLLVATTVIEVGVDVPNATIMVIEHSERFGLAQLHQLRGRVGRNDKESTCILLYEPSLSEIAQERLKVMRETTDGFKIAEADLRLRGGGEVAGTRQSGFPDYRFVNPFEHKHLMELAYTQARKLLPKLANPNTLESNTLTLLLKLFNKDDTLKYIRSG